MSRFQWPLAALASTVLLCACGGLAPGSGPVAPSALDLGMSPGPAPEPGFAPADAYTDADAPLRTEVLTDPGELPVLKVVSDGLKPLPLQHTDVKATVSGFTADVQVKQTYANPYDK